MKAVLTVAILSLNNNRTCAIMSANLSFVQNARFYSILV